jgi:predicted transcriptional regulator
MESVKTQVKEIAQDLPEDVTWDEVHYQLYIREKIAAGQQAVDEGRVTSHEEVKARFLATS